MNSTEILDAVNARLLEKWPERTVYINVCPEDYERPSFWLEVTRDDRTPVTQRMTKRNVQIRLTLHDEADEHYDISWASLADRPGVSSAIFVVHELKNIDLLVEERRKISVRSVSHLTIPPRLGAGSRCACRGSA